MVSGCSTDRRTVAAMRMRMRRVQRRGRCDKCEWSSQHIRPMLAERSDDASLLLVLLHCCTCLSLLFTSAAECCAGIVDALDVAASIVQLRSAAHEDTAVASSTVVAAHARCLREYETARPRSALEYRCCRTGKPGSKPGWRRTRGRC